MLTEPERLIFDIPDAANPAAAHRLVCWQWGDPAASDTVMCVHGLTRNGRDFDLLASELANTCRVLCPDMPGRGESQWLNDAAGYNNAAYIANIRYLLDRLNITRLHWIGTSMGGILGMMIANALPGALRSLTLNDIGCVISATGLKRIASYAGESLRFVSRAEAEAALRLRCATFGIRDESHWQLLFVHSIQSCDGGYRLAYDPAIAAGFPPPEKIVDMELWPLWEKVKPVPVLLIRGETSDILTRPTALAMKAQHPHLDLYEVPGAGHAPALMAREQVAAVRNWLQK